MKKKVALSATAIAVLASTIPTYVAPVEAAGNVIYVNSTGAGNQNDGGNGSQTNPYKQLSTAVANAQDGDTIVVVGEGYVNDLWGGGPWVINKDITIKGQGDVPPSLGIRPAGIVLGGNVKFEFVDINLYNASSAYMYANGHKLELINSTFSVNTQPIKLYAGLKADSSNQGSHGSIIVKTDSSFKGNGKKVAIDTIYAGGESGTNSIPADIQVSQGASNSITLTNIVGQDSSNVDISSDMSVTLHEIDPVIYGGTGNNTLTMSSVNLRGLNIHRINTVNLTQGSFELTDDSITEIPKLSIGSGATLDLTERWDDLTIGTYTGQGGIILPNDSTKVSITNPVGASESLSIYLQGYNKFTEINGWHERDFTYVTTANKDARIQLYGDNDFKSGYDFIPIESEGRYEWQVAKPAPVTPDTPNPPEEEEKDPVLTTITTTETTQTVNVNSYDTNPAHEVEYILGVSTDSDDEGEEVWLTDFVDDLVVTVNGKPMVFKEDDSVYYNAEEGVEVYLEPGSTPRTQRVLVSFHDEDGNYNGPAKEEYSIQIGTATIPSVTLTLNVEGLEAPPTEPSLPNLTDVNFDTDTHTMVYGINTTKTFNYTLSTDGQEQVTNLNQYPITISINGKELTSLDKDLGLYGLADTNVLVEVADGEIVVTDASKELKPGNHTITINSPEYNIDETLTLVVEEQVKRVTIEGEDTLTFKLEEFSTTRPDIKYDLKLELADGVTSPVDLMSLGFEVRLDGTALSLINSEDGIPYCFVNEDENIRVTFDKDPDNITKQKMVVEFADQYGGTREAVPGTYEFSLIKDSNVLDTVTLVVEGEEEQPLPTITGFENANYLTSGTGASDISTMFKVNFSDSSQEQVEFHEIEGSKVSFNGEELVLRDGKYTNSANTVILSITPFSSVGTYSICLERKSEQELLPIGKHSFTLEASGHEATVDFDVKPIIDTLTADGDKEVTITKDTDKPSFEFTVDGRGDLSALDLVEDFKITINGKDAEEQTVDGDDKVYFKSLDSKVEAYIVYDEQTKKYQLFLQPFSNDGSPEYTEEEYTITLSSGTYVTPLTFTVNVQKEEQPTKLPYSLSLHQDCADGVTTTLEDSTKGVSFLVLVRNADGAYAEEEFHELGISLEFGDWKELGVYDEETGAYYFNSHNVKATVEKQENGYHKLTFTKLDEDGNPTNFNPSSYHALLGINTTGPTRVAFTVTEPEPPSFKITKVDIPEKTVVNTEGTGAGIRVPFTVEVEGSGDIRQEDYTFTVNDKKFIRNGEGTYLTEDGSLLLELSKLGNNEYQFRLFQKESELGLIPVDPGNYIIKGESETHATFEFNIEVESGEEEIPPTPPPTPPTTEPEDKEEEKEEPTNPPSSGGGSTSGGTTNPPSQGGGSSSGNTGGGGTTTEPTTPPSGGSTSGGGSTGGSTSGGSSSGGGSTLPAPDPKPEKPAEKPPVVDKPTPVPPKPEEVKPTTRPTAKPGAVSNPVEDLEDLATEIREKVDSLMAEVLEEAKGLILDLTGDADDLSSVSTLEVTKDGIFANVDGEKVKFATDLKLEDMSKLRIIRADGSPVPYITNGESFVLSTSDFSDILITERVVEPFVDVAKDDWFQPYVDELYNRGVTTGTTASTFSPNDTITRAQLAALLARAYELKPTGDKPALKDIANQWYANDVQALVDHGIIKGYEDGTFRGDKEITREQLVLMLQRTAEMQGKDTTVSVKPQFADKDKVDPYSMSALEWAASQGIINSGKDTAFKPKKSATRAQVAKMLTLFINK